jgi:hypothetical protein
MARLPGVTGEQRSPSWRRASSRAAPSSGSLSGGASRRCPPRRSRWCTRPRAATPSTSRRASPSWRSARPRRPTPTRHGAGPGSAAGPRPVTPAAAAGRRARAAGGCLGGRPRRDAAGVGRMLHRPLPDTTRSLGDRTSESIYLRSPWYLILGDLAQANPSQNAAHDVDRRCPARVGEGTELIEDLGNVLRSDDGSAIRHRADPSGRAHSLIFHPQATTVPKCSAMCPDRDLHQLASSGKQGLLPCEGTAMTRG